MPSHVARTPLSGPAGSLAQEELVMSCPRANLIRRTFAVLPVAFVMLLGCPLHSGAASCPGAIQLEANGSSRADFGWTGIIHDQSLVGWNLRLAVSNCAGSPPTCGACDLGGLLPNPGRSNKRCSGNTALT